MSDRLVGGAVSALALAITWLALVLCFSVYRGGLDLTWQQALWSALPPWLAALAAIGFAGGFLAGSERAIGALAHLWGTAHPRYPLLTAACWAILLGLGWAGHHLLS